MESLVPTQIIRNMKVKYVTVFIFSRLPTSFELLYFFFYSENFHTSVDVIIRLYGNTFARKRICRQGNKIQSLQDLHNVGMCTLIIGILV